jgi:hypothetical protein
LDLSLDTYTTENLSAGWDSYTLFKAGVIGVQSGHHAEEKYKPRTLDDEIAALSDGKAAVSILVEI